MTTTMPVLRCLQLRKWKITCSLNYQCFLLCLNSSVHTHTHIQSLNIILSSDFWINPLIYFMFYNDCLHFNKKSCLFTGKPTQSLNIILALNSYINPVINFVLWKKIHIFMQNVMFMEKVLYIVEQLTHSLPDI